jgi:hypothetical protein
MAGIAAMASFCPRRMIAPLPNCFSIWPTAISTALARSRSFRSSAGGITLLTADVVVDVLARGGTTAGGIPLLFTCSLFTSSMFTSSVSTGPVTGEVNPPRRESWSD